MEILCGLVGFGFRLAFGLIRLDSAWLRLDFGLISV